jgi:hypothetical protein
LEKEINKWDHRISEGNLWWRGKKCMIGKGDGKASTTSGKLLLKRAARTGGGRN